MKASGDEDQDGPRPAALGPLGGYWRVAVIGLLGLATIALHALSASGSLDSLRAGVTLAFMAAGPGMAAMGLLRLDDLLLELSLALALSLVIETIIAMAMIILKHWVPSDGLFVVEALTALGGAGQIYQLGRVKQRARHQHEATRS